MDLLAQPQITSASFLFFHYSSFIPYMISSCVVNVMYYLLTATILVASLYSNKQTHNILKAL